MVQTNAQRFTTLDVFRGMTIFAMIIVNTQGGGAVPYHQLMHADWNGCTFTDLVFPSFLFAVGNALPFAAKKWEGYPNDFALRKIFNRTILLFLVGFALSWYTTLYFISGGIAFAPLVDMRLLAVLQRIALCYGLAALLTRYIQPYGLLIVSSVILLGYWSLLYYGGEVGDPYGKTGNLVRAIDLRVIGARHMYRERGFVFDPEGLLSTLPATVNVIAGYLAGVFIQKSGRTTCTAGRLFVSGIALLLVALLWNQVFPFNKKLWTSSFVLQTTGIDLLLLAALYYAIEILQWKRGTDFFSVFGRNPLFIYILSNLFLVILIWPMNNGQIWIDWIGTKFFQQIAPGPLGCLLFAVSFTLLCWTAGWGLDRKKIYIRL